MSNLTLTIAIESEGKGLDDAIRKINDLKDATAKATERAATAAAGNAASLTKAFLAAEATKAAIEGVAHQAERLVQTFGALVRHGLEFNAALQTGALLTGALLNNFQKLYDASGRVVDGPQKLNVALQIAANLQDQLRVRSLQTGLSYQSLDATMRTILATSHGQVRDAEQLLDLTTKLAKSGTVLGFDGVRMMQEVRGMMAGGRPTELGIMLGITQEDIRKARDLGGLTDLLSKKLEVFGRTAEMYRHTLPGALGALKAAWEQALGEGTQGQLGRVTTLVDDLTKQIVTFDEKGHAAFNPALVDGVSNVAASFVKLAESATKFAGTLPAILDFVSRLLQPDAQKIFMAISGGITGGVLGSTVGPLGTAAGAVGGAAIGYGWGALQQHVMAPYTNWYNAPQQDPSSTNLNLYRLRGLLPVSAQQQLMQLGQGGASEIANEFAFTNAPQEQKLKTLITLLQSGTREAERFRQAFASIDQAGPNKPAGLPTFGQGGKPPLDEEVKRAMDQLRERVQLETQLLRLQQKQSIEQQKKAEIGQKLSSVDRQLAQEKLRVGGAQLDQFTQSLILQDRMLRMRQADLDVSIALTAEERKHAEELAKIDKDQRANEANAGKDPRAALPSSLFTAARDAEFGRFIDAQRKIRAEGDAARQKARDENKKIAQDTLADDRKRTDERIRQEDAVFGLQAEHIAKTEDLYQQMFDSIQRAQQDMLVAIFKGQGIGGAVRSFADDFSRILATQLTQRTDDWFDRMRNKATEFLPRLDENGKPVVGADGRPVLDKNAAYDPRVRAGMTGLQGAAAIYGIYSAGQQGARRTDLMLGGAMQGAMIGGANPFAAVALALVGAMVGALSSKERPWFDVSASGGKISIRAGNGAAKSGDVAQAAQQINSVVDSALSSFSDILTSFPLAIAQGMGSIKPSEILKNFDVRHFNSSTLQTFLQTELPQMILQAYMPVISGGLKDLGVSQGRINDLFATAKAKAPNEAFQFIRDYISEFVKLKDYVDFIGKSPAEKAGIAASSTKSAPQQLSDLNDRILLLTKNFSDLTSDQQLARVKQINELTSQRYELELQYLNDLANTASTVHKAVSEQVFGMQMADMSRPAAMAALQAKRQGIMAQIASSTDPAKIADLAQQYQTLTGQLYQFAVAVRDEFKSLIDGFTDLADKPGKDARSSLPPVQRIQAINAAIGELAYNFEGLTSEEQLSRGREILNLANEAYDVQKQALQQIADLSTQIGHSIDQQIFEIQQDQRNPQAQLDALLGRQRDLYAQLASANSADEVNFIISQLQQNAGQVYQLEGKNPQAAANTIDMLRQAGDLAQKKLHEFGSEIEKSMNTTQGAIKAVTDTLTASFNDASKTVTDLQGDLQNLDTAVTFVTNSLRDKLGYLDKALDPLAAILQAFGSSTTDLTGDLDGAGDAVGRFTDKINAATAALDNVVSFPSRYFSGGDSAGAAAAVVVQPIIQVQIAANAKPFIDAVTANAVATVEDRQFKRARAAALTQRTGAL